MSMRMMDMRAVSLRGYFLRTESWTGKGIQDATIIDTNCFCASAAEMPELRFQQLEFINPLRHMTDMFINQGIDL